MTLIFMEALAAGFLFGTRNEREKSPNAATYAIAIK